MGESEIPEDSQSADETAQWPPPEWGKEVSPTRGKIITATVVVLCVIVAAGVAIWSFDRLGSEEDTTRAKRPKIAHDVEVTSSTTSTQRGANEANVGDCVHIVAGGVDAQLAVVDCGTAEARYTVALELEMSEKCPADSYVEYTAMGMGGWSLCLALNATAGQCFDNNITAGFIVTDCATAQFRVAAVLPNTADENACPPPPPNALFYPKPVVYPTPPLTVCLASIPR